MFKAILTRFRQGHRTMVYPDAPLPLPPDFVDSRCWTPHVVVKDAAAPAPPPAHMEQFLPPAL